MTSRYFSHLPMPVAYYFEEKVNLCLQLLLKDVITVEAVPFVLSQFIRLSKQPAEVNRFLYLDPETPEFFDYLQRILQDAILEGEDRRCRQEVQAPGGRGTTEPSTEPTSPLPPSLSSLVGDAEVRCERYEETVRSFSETRYSEIIAALTTGKKECLVSAVLRDYITELEAVSGLSYMNEFTWLEKNVIAAVYAEDNLAKTQKCIQSSPEHKLPSPMFLLYVDSDDEIQIRQLKKVSYCHENFYYMWYQGNLTKPKVTRSHSVPYLGYYLDCSGRPKDDSGITYHCLELVPMDLTICWPELTTAPALHCRQKLESDRKQVRRRKSARLCRLTIDGTYRRNREKFIFLDDTPCWRISNRVMPATPGNWNRRKDKLNRAAKKLFASTTPHEYYWNLTELRNRFYGPGTEVEVKHRHWRQHEW